MFPYVLVIEPDADFREMLVKVFKGQEIEAVGESDNAKGVARIIEREPHAILLAEGMPSLDGLEMLPLTRRLTVSPIIVVGEGGEMAVVKALLQGADMYLRRPVNHVELLSRVRAVTRRADRGTQRRVSSSVVAERLGRWARDLFQVPSTPSRPLRWRWLLPRPRGAA